MHYVKLITIHNYIQYGLLSYAHLYIRLVLLNRLNGCNNVLTEQKKH